MNTHEILKLARAKIERPECWTQGAFARDANGRDVENYSRAAVCWCSMGAMKSVTRDCGEATKALLAFMGGNYIPYFNDTRTHAEVLAAFDKAIEATAP